MELFDVIIKVDGHWGRAKFDLPIEKARRARNKFISHGYECIIVPAWSNPE